MLIQKNESSQDELEQQDSAQDEDDSPLADYQLARDRERRESRPAVQRYGYTETMVYALMTIHKSDRREPTSYTEAMVSQEKDNWFRAMKEEMNSLIKSETWILVERPKNQKIMRCKWIYKKNEASPGKGGVQFNARLVARGFTREFGVHYNKVFAPLVKQTSIRIILICMQQTPVSVPTKHVRPRPKITNERTL